RHGLQPCGHRQVVPRPHFQLAASRATARGLLRSVRREAAACQEEGGDWRAVIDALRPEVPGLWRSMDLPERARFLRHVAPRWDVHRHRVAPEVEQLLDSWRREGSLTVLAGRVEALSRRGRRVAALVRPRGQDESMTIVAD